MQDGTGCGTGRVTPSWRPLGERMSHLVVGQKPTPQPCGGANPWAAWRCLGSFPLGVLPLHLFPSHLQGWVWGLPPWAGLGRGPMLWERGLGRPAPWAVWTQLPPAVASLCSDRGQFCAVSTWQL